MKNKKRFPTSMFATATIVSGAMVFIISAVFNQANQPCLSNHVFHNNALHSNVIIDTTNNKQTSNDGTEALSVCNRNNQQIGWLTWLFKRSDSVEFHYLDLLELLSRK